MPILELVELRRSTTAILPQGATHLALSHRHPWRQDAQVVEAGGTFNIGLLWGFQKAVQGGYNSALDKIIALLEKVNKPPLLRYRVINGIATGAGILGIIDYG